MPIYIDSRECARQNAEHTDCIAAFTNKEACSYHYEDGTFCAIGIMIPRDNQERNWLQDGNRVWDLIDSYKVIKTDSPKRLQLIQHIHDAILEKETDKEWLDSDLRDFLNEHKYDLTDCTPARYREIMLTIALS